MELTDVARQCAGLDGIDSVYRAGDVGTDGSAQETPPSSSTSTGSLRMCRPRRRSPKRDVGDTRHADRDTPKLPSQTAAQRLPLGVSSLMMVGLSWSPLQCCETSNHRTDYSNKCGKRYVLEESEVDSVVEIDEGRSAAAKSIDCGT